MPTTCPSSFCASCQRESSDLQPFRFDYLPTHYATPVFCPSCFPGKRTPSQLRLRMQQRRRMGEPLAGSEVDRASSIAKLLKPTSHPYVPAPMFTPLAGRDAVTSLKHLKRTEGWRFENGEWRRDY